MKIIKLYDKAFNSLASLTEADFINLIYQRTQGEIGDCSFTVKISSAKMTDLNISHYNRVRVYDNGTLVFTGIITQKRVSLTTVDIKCRELSYILKKRCTTAGYTLSGSIVDTLTTLLTDINAIEDTGISVGILGGGGSVNLTFNRSDVWTAIKQICESTGNQFEISPAGKLNMRTTLGTDLSASVYFRYDVNQVANANIFDFDIDDDGDSIITQCHGESNGLLSNQSNGTLISRYGVLESYKDFRVVNSQPVLDQFTTLEIQDKVYSPKITLKPNVTDNFNIFDVVKVRLKNSLVNIDSTYQIIQKRVKYLGSQKVVEVRINNVPNYLSQMLADRDRRLTLLEKEV